MKNVIVFVEHRQGQTRKVTFEIATRSALARRLARRQSLRRRRGRRLWRSWPQSCKRVSARRDLRCRRPRRRSLPARSGRRLSLRGGAGRRPVARFDPEYALRPRCRRAADGASAGGPRRRRSRDSEDRRRRARLRFAEARRRADYELCTSPGRVRHCNGSPKRICRRATGGSGAEIVTLAKPSRATTLPRSTRT